MRKRKSRTEERDPNKGIEYILDTKFIKWWSDFDKRKEFFEKHNIKTLTELDNTLMREFRKKEPFGGKYITFKEEGFPKEHIENIIRAMKDTDLTKIKPRGETYTDKRGIEYKTTWEINKKLLAEVDYGREKSLIDNLRKEHPVLTIYHARIRKKDDKTMVKIERDGKWRWHTLEQELYYQRKKKKK